MSKETKTIGINMPKEMAVALETRSASMHLTTSNYCRMILKRWLESGEKLQLEEII